MHILKRVASAAIFLVILATGAFACGGSYQVKSGDTLSGIARAEIGSFFAYQSLFEANGHVIGSNPDRIQAGMTLQLPCPGQPVNWAVMPSAATIAQLQQVTDIQVLDIRRPTAVAKGIIPGAVSVPYSQWRGPAGATPTDVELSRIVGDAGLRVDQPVLIVHSQPDMMDTGRAAMVYWLLKSSGFDTIAILKDGFQGWTEAGLPTAAAPAAPSPYDAELLFSYKWRADELDVYAIATSQITGYLLDARPQHMFSKVDDEGKQLGTTLPNARSAPIGPLMSAFGSEVPVETAVKAVADHLQRHNANWETGEVITFCQTGELGALSWFYASELAGLDNMLLYPESVAGWADGGGRLFAGLD